MNNYKLLAFLSVIQLISVGCKKQAATEQSRQVVAEYKIQYAQGFMVNKYAGYTEVSVRNPWDTTQLLQTYILVDKQQELPANLPKGTLVRTPLNNVVAYSTIHCTTLKELNAVGIVKGVCEPEYIKIAEIQAGIENETIIGLGLANSPDVEKIILLDPEAIFAAPISGEVYGNVEKAGIPIIETPDYTEPLPLGRAEWMRFYSLFVGQEALADSLFNITVSNYNAIRSMVTQTVATPLVLSDTKYQNSWNMPGGKSYMSNMIANAGGLHPWADNNSATFLPLAFETVLDKAGEADIWIIKYHSPQDMTYSSLAKEYKPYSYFKPFKERNIWGCNTYYTSYYEDLPIHPDYILKDFAAIFHPESMPDYTTKYYKKLTE